MNDLNRAALIQSALKKRVESIARELQSALLEWETVTNRLVHSTQTESPSLRARADYLAARVQTLTIGIQRLGLRADDLGIPL